MKPVPVVFRLQAVDITDPDSGEVRRINAMVPLPRFGNVVARQFVEGEDYKLVIHEDRSMASHNHYFASVQDGFDNLPEKIAARWPSSEHLRAWCLIETGWFDEKEFDCDTERQAKMLSSFIRTERAFARISVHGNRESGWKVIVRTAKSQSIPAMGKDAFQRSKTDVLDLVSSMVGVTTGDLKRNAGRSA